MTTTYLFPSTLKGLADVSVSPGAGQDGYPLVWNNATGQWVVSLLPYSSLSGAPALPIPVASGGTGTQTGSITGTGSLTFTAGGTNQNINLIPSGTGLLNVSAIDSIFTQPANTNTGLKGITLSKSGNAGFFKAINGTSDPQGFYAAFYAKTTMSSSSLNFFGLQSTQGDHQNGVVLFSAFDAPGTGPINPAHKAICFSTWDKFLVEVFGSGDTKFNSTTESTLTTNGAIRVAGGVGIAKNLNVGGTKINFANLPTSSSGLSVGDLWRDGENVKVKI